MAVLERSLKLLNPVGFLAELLESHTQRNVLFSILVGSLLAFPPPRREQNTGRRVGRVRFLWRRLLLRNQSQSKHSGTEIPLQGVSSSDLTWVEVAQPLKRQPDTQTPWKRASNPAGVRGDGQEGALGAAPSSIMCGTAPVRRRVFSPGPGPLGQAPDSAVPGAVLREQPASPCRAIVPRLSAECFQLWQIPFLVLGTRTTCLCHTELGAFCFLVFWDVLTPVFCIQFLSSCSP